MQYEQEVTGGVPGGTKTLKGSKGHEPKSVLNFKNTSAKS